MLLLLLLVVLLVLLLTEAGKAKEPKSQRGKKLMAYAQIYKSQNRYA